MYLSKCAQINEVPELGPWSTEDDEKKLTLGLNRKFVHLGGEKKKKVLETFVTKRSTQSDLLW